MKLVRAVSNAEAEELSLVTAVIRENEILHGTVFQTFDGNYKIAKAFIEKYGVDEVKWGVEHGMEFEEVVFEFATNYAKENNMR